MTFTYHLQKEYAISSLAGKHGVFLFYIHIMTVCFCKQSKAGKQTTQVCNSEQILFREFPEQNKQKRKQTKHAKRLVRRCSEKSGDQNNS